MKTEVPPMVDQIECHPGLLRRETIDYCKRNGIVIEAWSPMGSGAIFQNETVKEISENIKRVLHTSVFAGACSMVSFLCQKV